MTKANNAVKKEWHAPRSPKGSGDYYGVGIRNPIGRIRESYMIDQNPMSSKKMGTPPKSLA